MEPLVGMKRRKKAFKEGNPRPVVVNDSRFGIRKLSLNDTEKAKEGVYFNPGRGASGESSV
jgi:hypothetical protein